MSRTAPLARATTRSALSSPSTHSRPASRSAPHLLRKPNVVFSLGIPERLSLTSLPLCLLFLVTLEYVSQSILCLAASETKMLPLCLFFLVTIAYVSQNSLCLPPSENDIIVHSRFPSHCHETVLLLRLLLSAPIEYVS